VVSGASVGIRTDPSDADTAKPWPRSESAPQCGGNLRRCVLGGLWEQRAELVSAQAVDLSGGVDRLAQRPPEAREQRVARGMAEGVVVELEAVEVEEQQQSG